MIMGFVRGKLSIRAERTWATIGLRGLAAVIAAYGVHSLFALDIGSKLLMRPSMEFWDFEREVSPFFAHLVCIVGLGAFVAHYGLKLIRIARVR
jgi:hypothetical protein